MNIAHHRWTRRLCRIGLSAVALLAGCQGLAPSGELMALQFSENQPLHYEFRSERAIDLELTGDKPDKAKTQRESLDLVMRIDPVEANPFGLSTLRVTCESARVSRTSFTGKPGNRDAVESLAGKSYTIQVSPTGKLENIEGFEAALKEIGEKSIVQATPAGQRIKDLDMIFDWMYFQLYLWDAVASVEKPLAGVAAGEQWRSRQLLPWPIPIPNMPSGEVTYTLEEIRPAESGRQAVIAGNFALSEQPVRDFPLPYVGGFQVRGSLFSVLHSYVYEYLEGSGTQVFNLDTGVLEEAQQQYTIKARASFILPLGNSVPILTVQQKFSVRRLDASSGEPVRAAQ
jgi:hypothetical protein